MKLGLIIVATIAVNVTMIAVGISIGVPILISALVAGLLALGMVQLLARGMTSPLRDMATGAREMAAGNYSRRISSNSRDEVGELARAFNAMAAEVAETDRMRRDLIANVSHELRTPISGLQAALENLVDGVAEPDQQTLRTMLGQTERLGRLVSELLDLSRLESGTVPLNRTPVLIADLLNDCKDEANLLRPDVELGVNVSPASLTVDGDEERLRQVIMNLVTNALRVSPEGSAISMACAQHDDTVQIEISDNGPGIPENERVRVFERFYRADSSRAAGDQTGAGLGLAIVKWIVELHGGTVRAEANIPTGTRMVVRLPVTPS